MRVLTPPCVPSDVLTDRIEWSDHEQDRTSSTRQSKSRGLQSGKGLRTDARATCSTASVEPPAAGLHPNLHQPRSQPNPSFKSVAATRTIGKAHQASRRRKDRHHKPKASIP